MNFYTYFWQHNTTAAVLLHAVTIVVICAAIDGLTYERRMFNLRTREDQRTYPENTDHHDY